MRKLTALLMAWVLLFCLTAPACAEGPDAETPIVYMTTEITPEAMLRIY